MLRRPKTEKKIGPSDCGLHVLDLRVERRTKRVFVNVPDPESEAYSQSIGNDGSFYASEYNSKAGKWLQREKDEKTTVVVGEISCRRMSSAGVQPIWVERKNYEDAGDAVRGVVESEYCGSCPYALTGNLDPLSAAQYDLEVAQAEQAAAEVAKHTQTALAELGAIGIPQALSSPTEKA